MTEQKREMFQETLTQAYDHERYIKFIRELLNDVQLVAPRKNIKVWNTFSVVVDYYNHIGNYTAGEDKVALLSVCLKRDKSVENARSMQRSFVKTLLENSNCSGALVAFHNNDAKKPEEKNPKWRFSLVRMDFEFSKGKISEKLTPAKRYSYLVGEGEPCHTAQERLYPIFASDERNPSLDELEAAFSVEAVTKEFFDKYREKYLDLKEYLESNTDFMTESQARNFTSEQFAKKLMGQIAFLYFIQKKGWLGVNAFPKNLTEREYKAAFYRSGQKPKELMPYVYKQAYDGLYYRNNQALLSLSTEDETLLSTLVKGDKWGDGPKDFMRQIFKGCVVAEKNFFDDYLEPLFYTGLNKNRGENAFFPPLHRRIPFLNGGLFEELDEYEWQNNDFSIPNELFSNLEEKGRDADGILDIFDRYNFTMAEDEPMEREVAIDPEMLGKVFENLLDVKDRKSKGAFYTPREIVHYMCQESLINYLVTKTQIEEEDIRKFILFGEYYRDEDARKTLPVDNNTGKILQDSEVYAYKHHMEFDKNKELEIPESIFSYKKNVNRLLEIDELLANIKVVDPAVGSGAFPLGMLNEIVKARDTITTYMAIDMNRYERLNYRSYRSLYLLKRNTIKNCIFACDIESSATDIAKLRLWLSLVIDNQIMDQTDDVLGYSTKPRELPNLDCNIICGNSLVEEFYNIPLITESTALKNISEGRQGSIYDQKLVVMINELIDLQSKLYDEKDHTEKGRLKDKVQYIYDQIVLEQLKESDNAVEAYYKSSQNPSKPFVLWQMQFPKVFRDNGGFDIVIGNPPYVDSEVMKKIMPDIRLKYSKIFQCAKGNWDEFVVFIEKGLSLLNQTGIISFIVPNKLISAPYTSQIRKLLGKYTIREIRDYSNVTVFKAAAVYPLVFRVQANVHQTKVTMDVMGSMEQVSYHNVIAPEDFYKDIDWDKYFCSSELDLEIIDKINTFPKLGTLAKVNGAATVNEAYLIKNILFDGSYRDVDTKKFINTGGIDPYKSFHGKSPIRYLKESYHYPLIKNSDLKSISQKRYKESCLEKIIIGGMTKKLECYYDKGEYLAGKSTVIVYDFINLKLITAILNSKLMTYFYRKFFNSMSLAGGFFRIGVQQVKSLPISLPTDPFIIEKIENLVDKIQLSIGQEKNEDINGMIECINTLVYQTYRLSSLEIDRIENEF